MEDALHGTKWDIIKAIAQRPLSPKELSEQLGTSLSNISLQLKMLDAYGIVTSKSSERKGTRKLYMLKKDIVFTALADRLHAHKRFLEPDERMPLFHALFLPKKISMPVTKLYCTHYELLSSCLSFGYLDHDDKLEMLAVDERPERLFGINDEPLMVNGSKLSINVHIHGKKDFLEAFEEKDPYHVDVVNKVFLLLDNDFIARLRKTI